MSPEIALRAVGTALAGLSVAFAGYMLAQGGGRVRVNGMEHLAIFAQPRGAASAANALILPSLGQPAKPLDMSATGSFDASRPRASARPPVEILAARADRVWLRIRRRHSRRRTRRVGARRRAYRVDRSARRRMGLARRQGCDVADAPEARQWRGSLLPQTDFRVTARSPRHRERPSRLIVERVRDRDPGGGPPSLSFGLSIGVVAPNESAPPAGQIILRQRTA